MGAAMPMLGSAAGKLSDLAQRYLAPTEGLAQRVASDKMLNALGGTGAVPQDIASTMTQDAAGGVPSLIANAAPGLTDLAEAVAQRSGSAARKIEKGISEQRFGGKERVYGKVAKELRAGDYYDDLDAVTNSMRTRAAPLYDEAYKFGEVKDPEVLKFLALPQFQTGMQKAQELLAAEGRQMDFSKPTVEVLDQTKRGIDRLIESETDSVTGKTTSLGRVLIQKKNEFLAALDNAVPKYGQARAVYRGDAEMKDALQSGMKEFIKTPHEQVIKKIGGLSDAEKQLYRTGVTRAIYSKMFEGSNDFNAAKRIIGSAEMQAKMQPLFDNPGQFKLFKAALEREAQLFQEGNRILGNSRTAKRGEMLESLEDDSGLVGTLTTTARSGLAAGVVSLINGIDAKLMSDRTANKLADMLMSKKPEEVAAVVRMLEKRSEQAAQQARRKQVGNVAAASGTAASIWPATPADTIAQPKGGADIYGEMEAEAPLSGPDIYADMEAEDRAR